MRTRAQRYPLCQKLSSRQPHPLFIQAFVAVILRYLVCLFVGSLPCFLAHSAHAKAQLAIIIDDIGYNAALGSRAAELDGPFTLAVLPLTPHTHQLADYGYQRGKEIMLHLPMSNIKAMPLGKGGLESGMSHAQFLTQLRASLEDIPHLLGVNNHMGSRLTQESEAMDWLMRELAQRQLYFIDSRTTANTRALSTARSYQIPSDRRDVFLDNTRTSSSIQAQLLKAIALAQKRGHAIAIGHPYPETLAVLEQAGSLFDHYDVELVPVSQLLLSAKPSLISARPAAPKICYAPPMSLWIRPSSPPELINSDSLLHDIWHFSY